MLIGFSILGRYFDDDRYEKDNQDEMLKRATKSLVLAGATIFDQTYRSQIKTTVLASASQMTP